MPFQGPRTSLLRDDELTPPEPKTEPEVEIYQSSCEERILTEPQDSESIIDEEPREERWSNLYRKVETLQHHLNQETQKCEEDLRAIRKDLKDIQTPEQKLTPQELEISTRAFNESMRRRNIPQTDPSSEEDEVGEDLCTQSDGNEAMDDVYQQLPPHF